MDRFFAGVAMRALLAIALLSSSAHAALMTSPPGQPGWLKVNLPAGPAWHARNLDNAFRLVGSQFWTDAPEVALWSHAAWSHFSFHDFSPELTLGLSEITLTEGPEIAAVGPPIPQYNDKWYYQREFTYTGAGHSRTVQLPAFFSPEPNAGAIMLLGCLALRRRR